MAKLFIGKLYNGDQLENNVVVIEDGEDALYRYLNGLKTDDYVLPFGNTKRKATKLTKLSNIDLSSDKPQANFVLIKTFEKPVPYINIRNCKYFKPDINLLNKSFKSSQGVGFFEITITDDILPEEIDFLDPNNMRRFFICTEDKTTSLDFFKPYDICVVVDNATNLNITRTIEFNGNEFYSNDSLWELYKQKNNGKYTLNDVLELNKHKVDKYPEIQTVIKTIKNQDYYFFNDPMKLYDNIISVDDSSIKHKPTATNEIIPKDNLLTSSANFSLNTILYGPPGTGKTYKAKLYAVALCEEKSIEEIEQEMELNKHEVLKRYKQLIDDNRIGFITFHQSYGYEEFIEGLRPKVVDKHITYDIKDGVFKAFCEDNNKTNKPAVFIIDEINRGNISKIFGELITLIEENKRGGADEEMSVKLPYSGEEFSVPQNIYILGTMNTADRSIALMDTALRRRFAFIELMPKPEIIPHKEVEGLDVVKMLETINKRIEVLYDREHTIGHAYFMGKELNLNELENIFRNKIIPLLQEYFYEDYKNISLVLGDDQKEEKKYRFFTNEPDGARLFRAIDDYNKPNAPYKLNEKAFNHIESYIKIY